VSASAANPWWFFYFITLDLGDFLVDGILLFDNPLVVP